MAKTSVQFVAAAACWLALLEFVFWVITRFPDTSPVAEWTFSKVW